MPNSKPLDQQLETEQKIIHLMLKSTQVIDELLDGGYGVNFFIDQHSRVVESIYQEFIDSGQTRLLTRESYRQNLINNNTPDIIMNMTIYDKCLLKAFANVNDLGYLKKMLVEGFIGRNMVGLLKDYHKDVSKGGYVTASRTLIDKLQETVTLTDTRRSVFSSTKDLKEEWFERLEYKKNNEDAIIRCGIPEIDESVTVGFEPQQLTLFVADVGGFKTSVMINVALNICEKGHNVLFIPLEMDRMMLLDRIISNRADVNFHKLINPGLLDDDDMDKISEAKIWLDEYGFYILDADERTSVSALKMEIEKHARVFKPVVVVIDYIANLQPDVRYGSRNDLEIGEILKSLRFLGKKYGFHIISAAQMGRSAIKSLREGKEGAVDSTSIHGSHQYSADSDTIFALMPNPSETDRIKIFTVKARYGEKGVTKELIVQPSVCKITSTTNTMETAPDGIDDLVEAMNQSPAEIKEATDDITTVEFATSFDDTLSDLDDPIGD